MNTSVLTKQQRKHSLSAKKTPVKGLRNVLAQPQDNFWPIVKTDTCPVLEEQIKKLMGALKRPRHLIPWSRLKQMTKGERAEAKKDAILKEGHSIQSELINSVVLGVNSVTRSLENNAVCCVLVDANIDPQLLVKHIIIMAQNKNLPVLSLPNLRTITLSTIGFATAACAFKNIVMESPDHHFHPLYTAIYEAFKDIPLPKNSFELFKDIKNVKETMSCEKDSINIEKQPQSESAETSKFTLSTSVYKYRSSRKERTFVPPSATDDSTSEPLTVTKEDNEFISLKNYESDECNMDDVKPTRYVTLREDKGLKKRKDYSKANKRADIKYMPLKVKRIQGNSNRVKSTKLLKQKKK